MQRRPNLHSADFVSIELTPLLQALQKRRKSIDSLYVEDHPQAPQSKADKELRLPPSRPAMAVVAEAPSKPDDVVGLESLDLRVTDTSIKVR